ncbi:MAG: hypothetical protein V4577_15505 [Bacteroidota bacterium]
MDDTMSREEKVALYENLIKTHPDAVRKGDTIPYTSLNGHMFSYFSKDDFLALRLPAKEREEFMEKHNAGLVRQYGIIQKEYVHVPDNVLKNTAELKTYFQAAFEYVKSLKPKPTSKKSK